MADSSPPAADTAHADAAAAVPASAEHVTTQQAASTDHATSEAASTEQQQDGASAPAASATAAGVVASESKPMTKGEMKRQVKKQRMQEKKEEKKRERRAAREQKERELLAAGQPVPWLQPKKERAPGERTSNQIKRDEVEQRAQEHGYRVLLDMSFFHLMNEKERLSLRQQVAFCYSNNNKAAVPANIILTGIGQEAEDLMSACAGFGDWAAVKVQHEGYLETFAKEELVYLTADSDVDLEQLDPARAYIIGAFVDKNRHKGATARRAKEDGIATARLPLDKYLNRKGTSVLTVNHVYDILLKAMAAGGDFQAAVAEAVPGLKRSSEGAAADCEQSCTHKRACTCSDN